MGAGSSAPEPLAVVLSQTGPPDTFSSSSRAETARAAPPGGRRGQAPAPTLLLPPCWTERGGPTWSEPRYPDQTGVGSPSRGGGSCLHNTGAKPAMGRQRQSSTQESSSCETDLPQEPALAIDALPTGDENSCPRKNPHTGVYCSFSHNCKKNWTHQEVL